MPSRIGMRRVLRVLLLAGLAVVVLSMAGTGLSGRAQAQGTGAAAAVGQGQPVATVELAGTVILRVRVPSGQTNVYARAEQVYKNLNEAIYQNRDRLSPDLVQVREVDGRPAIFVGTTLIVAVDQTHAKLNRTTPQGLARVWAANLKQALRSYIEINQLG